MDRVGRGHSFDRMRVLTLCDETIRTKGPSTRHDRPPMSDEVFGFIGLDGLSNP